MEEKRIKRQEKILMDIRAFAEPEKETGSIVISEYPKEQCTCDKSNSYCQAVWGCDQDINDNLGCGYAFQLAQCFIINPKDKEPIFKRAWTRPFQVKPLLMKNPAVEIELLNHIQRCKELNDLLDKKKSLRSSLIHPKLNAVHYALKNRLKNFKHNGIRSCLHHALFEVLPSNETQRQYLPSLEI